MSQNQEMHSFIDDLHSAIKGVPKKYVKYREFNGLEPDKPIEEQGFYERDLERLIDKKDLISFLNNQKETHEKSLESVFCYELYHKWKQIIHSQKGLYKDLVLNGEIGKMNLANVISNFETFKESDLYKEISTLKLLEQKNVYPDFTLHGGNNTVDNQKLIVEVKTGANLTNKNFKNDFYRLVMFQKLYAFEKVAFVVINLKIKDLVKFIEKVNLDLADKPNFYFFLRNEDSTLSFNLKEFAT